METIKQRKKRSDAKRTIKPTMRIKLKETIKLISDITEIPVKNVGETFCLYGLSNDSIINNLSKYFQSDIRINNTLHIGSIRNPKIEKRTAAGESDRITIRVSAKDYTIIKALAYGLDCTVATACSKVIEQTMYDFEFVDSYIKNYLKGKLDNQRLKTLEEIMTFVNQESEEETTFTHLFAHIVKQVKEPFMTVQDTVDQFLIHHWRD